MDRVIAQGVDSRLSEMREVRDGRRALVVVAPRSRCDRASPRFAPRVEIGVQSNSIGTGPRPRSTHLSVHVCCLGWFWCDQSVCATREGASWARCFLALVCEVQRSSVPGRAGRLRAGAVEMAANRGRAGAWDDWCFLRKGGAAVQLAGGACQPCLVDCKPGVLSGAQPTTNPTNHPNGNTSRGRRALTACISPGGVLGGAASFRRRDHARHWRSILHALINM